MELKLFVACVVLLCVLCFQGGFAEEFLCEPGVLYKENDCNTCICSKTRMMACGMKRCIYESRFILYNCKEGPSYFEECNQCWCVEGFGTICTNRKCA